MRVLLVSNLYPPYWVGGYEQIASWVTEGLRERGHTVTVLTGRGPAFDGRDGVRPGLDLDLADLKERYFDGTPAARGLRAACRRHVLSLRNLQATGAAIRELRPEVVSFWNPAFVTFAPLLAARLGGVPSVAHLSDTTANVFRNPHPPAFPSGFHGAARACVDLLLSAARPFRFVVPSAFLRDKLVRGDGLPPERTEVLHWPVEPRAGRTAPPARTGGARRILYVGSLIPEKGPDVLIDAFRQAWQRRQDLALTLVGEGPPPFVAKLRESARGLPATFLGRLERAAVLDVYAGHDTLAFPSVWDEPYAVVPLEAMAMGLAVVASDAGGTPEAVKDRVTGLLVPPRDAGALRDAILGLAEDAGLRRRLAENACAWAREGHGFPAFIERLERLYERAAGLREAP